MSDEPKWSTVLADAERSALADQLAYAISEAVSSAATLQRLRAEYEGYSFDYFHAYQIQAAQDDAKRVVDVIERIVDARMAVASKPA